MAGIKLLKTSVKLKKKNVVNGLECYVKGGGGGIIFRQWIGKSLPNK